MSFLFSRPSFCKVYLENFRMTCQDRKYPGVSLKYPEVLLGSEEGPSIVNLTCTETKETSEGAFLDPGEKKRACRNEQLAQSRDEVSGP